MAEKEYKTRWKAYAAWEYRLELNDLNQASEQGWQLVRGGLLKSKFKKDDSVVYRYALDYNGNIQDPDRYQETFREQGWEYINATSNGWHYFRKVYDPTLPEEEYEIYTDCSSLAQMKRRWQRLALAMALIMLGLAIWSFVTATVVNAAIYLGVMGLLLLGYHRMAEGDDLT